MGRKENRKNKVKKDIKVNKVDNSTEEYDQVTRLIRIIIILTIVISATYLFIGVFITKEINFSNWFNNDKEVNQEVAIDYSQILGSQVFTQKPKEYYVIAYDYESEETDVINYVLQQNLLVTPYYYVNTNSQFNKGVVGTTSNKYAQNYKDLKINGTTLIKVSNNKNVEYIEGYDAVIKYLKDLKPKEK